MSENWKIQVSPKLSDGTLINLRAETPEQAEAILAWATNNADIVRKAIDAFGAVNNVQQVFPGAQTVQDTGGPSWSQQGTQQQSQPAQPAGQSCAHGAMVYRTGNSARGPWRAFMCPAPKGDPTQCKAVFLRD